MTTMIEIEQPVTIRPFDSGSQYADWTSSNCDRCIKSTYNEAKTPCDLENALLAADLGGGRITMEIAARIGLELSERYYGWPCAEVDWTPKWIAEWNHCHPAQCEHKSSIVISSTTARCTWGCGQTFAIS